MSQSIGTQGSTENSCLNRKYHSWGTRSTRQPHRTPPWGRRGRLQPTLTGRWSFKRTEYLVQSSTKISHMNSIHRVYFTADTLLMDTTIKVQISSDQIQAEISPVITRNADEPLLPNKKFNGEKPIWTHYRFGPHRHFLLKVAESIHPVKLLLR